MSSGRRTRRGLAPLELVFALPLLLAVLALIVNIGIEVKWKIRALVVSRQAVWRQRPGRNGAQDPNPAGWPTRNANFSVTTAPPPPLFAQDPFASQTVVRGPVLRDPNNSSSQGQFIVNTDVFDMSGKVEQGNARLDRSFPLLPKYPGVHLSVDQYLVDGQWRFWEMNIPRNDWRRTLILYRFTPPGNVLNLAQLYQEAATRLVNAPFRHDLDPLDRDEEIYAYQGSYHDFHPQLTRGCTLDPQAVMLSVEMLESEIQGPRKGGRGGVPENMANYFIRMYEDQLQQLQSQPFPPQGQISSLQKKIQQLRQFLGSLN